MQSAKNNNTVNATNILIMVVVLFYSDDDGVNHNSTSDYFSGNCKSALVAGGGNCRSPSDDSVIGTHCM